MLEISVSDTELSSQDQLQSPTNDLHRGTFESSSSREYSDYNSFSKDIRRHTKAVKVVMKNDVPIEMIVDVKQADGVSQNQLAHIDELITSFNEDVSRGWQALQESKMVSMDDPEEVAAFYYDNYGIDPDQLGELIGKASRGDIMRAFVLRNDFRGLSVADALRHLLRKFKPKGESAIIDRMLLAFAAAYTRDNPATFSHPDTAYQLSFALLLLNTSLHNPHAFKKAPDLAKSPKHFRKMITSELCPEEQNMTKHCVRDMYESIQSRPIELISDKYMTIFRDSVRSGLLDKRGHSGVKSWNRRLVVLSGHKAIGYAIYYFNGGQDRAWKEMIPLNEHIVCILHRKHQNVFLIRHRNEGQVVTAAKRRKDGSMAKDKQKQFMFRCEDKRQAMYWISAIHLCLESTLEERDLVFSATESSAQGTLADMEDQL